MCTQQDPGSTLEVPPLTPGAQRILEVASQLFYRHGIHAVGVDTIAAESGLTKRTLYDRFGSKEQLVATYLRARHQDWWRRLELRLAQAPDCPALTLFDSYAQDAQPSDRGCAFINAAAELPPEHPGREVIQAHKRAVIDRLTELIGHEDDPGTDAAAAAEEVFLLLEGALVHRGIDGDDHLLARAREAAARRIAPR